MTSSGDRYDQADLWRFLVFTTIALVLQADLKDVEFVYEGSIRNVQAGEPDGEPGKLFQGTFAHRSDGATAIDWLTSDQVPTHPQIRSIICLAGGSSGKLEELEFQPDRGKDASQLKTRLGNVSCLSQAGAPMRILLMPSLLEFLRDTDGFRTGNERLYESPGWEAIDGHRCLKVRSYSEARFENGPLLEDLYWIDLERGGTVVKHEYRYQGRLWTRADGIELASFPIAAGRSLWLPARGVYRSYVTGGRSPSGVIDTSSSPVFEESYVLVDGTPKLNQSLPDRRFTIEWNEAARAPLQSARSRQGDGFGLGRSKAARGLDVEVVEQADRQKRQLEASAPSREGFSATTLGVYALSSFGLALLAATLFLKWKGR